MQVTPLEIVRRQLTQSTHHIYSLPIVTLMPHSRCNCRCVMCDIWKANRAGQELKPDDLAAHMDSLKRLHVQWVILSGGEALMHSNLWTLCELLHELQVKITLLSTGLLLAPFRLLYLTTSALMPLSRKTRPVPPRPACL